MKILMYKWHAYNYLDIEKTFLSLGYSVDSIEQTLASYDEDKAFEMRLEKILRDGAEYDMVFTVNYFGCISNVCHRCHVKYVCWTCDSPLISMYHQSVYHDCNYIFCFDKTNYLEFRAMGVKHIWYLPLAVNTERLDYLLGDTAVSGQGEPASSEAQEMPKKTQAGRIAGGDFSKYQNEIAFVGSLYEKNSYDSLSCRIPDYLRGYFDAVVLAQLNISGGNIIEDMLTPDILEQLQQYFHLEKSKDSFSDIGLIFSTTVLGFKAAEVQRRRALLALSARYPVSVYSNSDTKELIRVNYRGGVDYWSEMPKVFRASKINLNFTIPNIKSGLPLRIWDVLGAGGFLMTNYQAELPLYLEEGKDYVCFESEQELVEKCGYYLTHERERLEIARYGYEKVKSAHTYRNRIEQMMELVVNE